MRQHLKMSQPCNPGWLLRDGRYWVFSSTRSGAPVAIKKEFPKVQGGFVKEHACQHTHHHPARTAPIELNCRYFSDTATPTGDTESQTDSDWIHYQARMGGGGRVKRTDTIRLTTDTIRLQTSK